jgi:hypothetical protein
MSPGKYNPAVSGGLRGGWVADRTIWISSRVFFLMSFPLPKLAVFVLSQPSVLRRADKHFDEVIVQGIVELALKAPLELGVVEIARMKVEVVGVDGSALIFEFDDDFDALPFRSRGKVQKRMLIQAKLGEDAVEARAGVRRHKGIVQTEKASVLAGIYQTRQAFCGIIGWPVLQPNAWPNSGMF